MRTAIRILRVQAAISAVLLLLVCAGENPYEDPQNVVVRISVGADTSVTYLDLADTLVITIHLELPDLVDYLIVDYGSAAEKRDTIGATTAAFADTLTVRHVFASAGVRTVRVVAELKDSDAQKSAEITVHVGLRPVIANNGLVMHPDILDPDTVYFLAVSASGSDTLGFAWRRNALPVSGASNDTLRFDSVTASDTGLYYCVVSNNWGADTSETYHLVDTFSTTPSLHLTITSPLMQGDSAVVPQSLLGIGGTASSPSGIASVGATVDTTPVAVLGTTEWSFAKSELKAGMWNRVTIRAVDNERTERVRTVFLYLKPALTALPAVGLQERLCTSIGLSWHKAAYCTQYLVYRFEADSQNLDTVLGTTDTVLYDSVLTAGTGYVYAVRAWYSVPGIDTIADTTPVSALTAARTVECFQKTYGGVVGDNAVGAVVTADSGCLVVGTSLSTRPGSSQLYLVRVNPGGDTMWTVAYGPSQNYEAFSARWGDSGEIVVGYGYTCGSCGMGDVASVATFSPANGQAALNKTLDRFDAHPAFDAIRTSDGGLALVSFRNPPAGLYPSGTVDSVAYVCKLSASGDTLWRKYLAFEEERSKAYSLAEAFDGALWVAGVSEFSGAWGGGTPPLPQCFVAKLSSSGDSLWSNTFGGGQYAKGARIRQTSDGGFIVAGESAVTGTAVNVYLLKTTAAGVQQWAQSYGGTGVDFGTGVVECAGGGFAVTGGTYSSDASDDCDVYLVRTDASGAKLWEAHFGGSGFDCGRDIAQTPDGGFVVAGETESHGAGGRDMFLIKTDSKGNTVPYTP